MAEVICYDCKKPINGRIVWLGEDYRGEGPHGLIEGPYPMHEKCADQPWPFYELSDAEAALWATHGNDAFAIVKLTCPKSSQVVEVEIPYRPRRWAHRGG